MTRTEWNKKKRILLSGKPVTWKEKDGQRWIEIRDSRYGKEYSLLKQLHPFGLECIICTWNLDAIADILVD